MKNKLMSVLYQTARRPKETRWVWFPISLLEKGCLKELSLYLSVVMKDTIKVLKVGEVHHINVC